MCSYLTSAETWKELLSNDFNRGYLVGVALVLAIVVLLLLLRIVLGLIFRTRRARTIVVTADDGDVHIAQDAVAAAVRNLLGGFPELLLDSLKIYRKGGRRYFLVLHCRFHSTERTFPDVVAQVKEKLFRGLEKQFGICDLRKIRIVLTAWDSTGSEIPEKAGDDTAETAPANGSDGF